MTRTQMKFIKFILGVGKRTPNMAILGEAAVLPLLLRAHIHMLKYWDRIRNMDDNTLVKLAYEENLQANSAWCKTIFTSSEHLISAAYTRLDPTRVPKQS